MAKRSDITDDLLAGGRRGGALPGKACKTACLKLEPFDALVAAAWTDGDLNRGRAILQIK